MTLEAALREALEYDPSTGVFRWRDGYQHGGAKGKAVAGSKNAAGYTVILLKSKRYFAHRLAWLYVYGALPTSEVDHVNMVKSDNRIANLRLASRAQNAANSKAQKNNKSGFVGVTFHSRYRKYQAGIQVRGKKFFLGYFDTAEDAGAARDAAAKKLHGEFYRPSKQFSPLGAAG
jgi:hypothetical protein